MNILFLLKGLDLGGLEIVTQVLANKFVIEGHHVCVFSFLPSPNPVEPLFDKRIKVLKSNSFSCSKENENLIRKILVEEHIQIVINQWGLPYQPLKVAQKAATNLNVKFLSVYHNQPSSNGRLQLVDMQIAETRCKIKKCCLKVKWKFFEKITSASMRYNYNHSDLFLVLSDSFIKNFQNFVHLKITPKLRVQTNPITIDTEDYSYNASSKTKEILYVGRIDKQQKRVERVIETWALVETKFPEWNLTIVGDGENRSKVEALSVELNLKRVSFEGYKSPSKYYNRASILVLTSEYEGFPLVIAESMARGIVPIVYGSYPAVYDIINNGENGLIVEPQNGQFSSSKMADSLASLMSDDDKREQMANNAISMVKNKFSIDIIYKQWMNLFSELK